MRVGGNVADHDLVFHTVNRFRFAPTHGGATQIAGTSGNVDKSDWIELGWISAFTVGIPLKGLTGRLTLTALKRGLDLQIT